MFMWAYFICFCIQTTYAESPFSNIGKKKEEQQEAISAAEKAAEKAKKDKQTRVLVLQWNNQTADFTDTTLQRNIASAIDRTEITFLPAVDLFQGGREIRDRTIPPERQPAKVPDENISKVLQAVNAIAGTPWDALTPNEWQEEGQKLLQATQLFWFVDRVELREPLFLLYNQLGNAANNMNNSVPPFFERIGPESPNYYWYLAATLAEQDPSLMNKVSDAEIAAYIQQYIDRLRSGVFPSMKIDFQIEGNFNKEDFDETYEVFVNGLPREIDSNGQIDVFLGRSDIYLKRKDTGHGLSDKYIADKTDEKAYTVMDNAHKLMIVEFREQLLYYENECSPRVGDNILAQLAIYAKMHPQVKEQIYITYPKFGNPNKMWIWRFDPSTTSLNLVATGDEEFPVHFVATIGTGMLFTQANVSFDLQEVTDVGGQETTEAIGGADVENGVDVSADGITNKAIKTIDGFSGYAPIALDLRGHYNNVMVNTGIEFGWNLNDEAQWIEYFQTPGKHNPSRTEFQDPPIKTLEISCDENNVCTNKEVFYEPKFNRAIYFGLGYAFGRDASYGLGPRVAFRSTFLNVPHSWVPTGHFGWAFQVGEAYNRRVRWVADVDLRLGSMIARQRSLYIDQMYESGETGTFFAPGSMEPIFGLTAGVGATF
jgi:hypothetical protein